MEARSQLMNQLFEAIEQAWRRDGDRAIVYRLADKHPELREELYEFFDDLVLGDTGDVSPDTRESEESITRWIHSAGVDLAIAAAKTDRPRTATAAHASSATTPDVHFSDPGHVSSTASPRHSESDVTWILFLRRRVGQSLPQLANALPNVNVEYLALVSRHPSVVPIPVRKALARLAEETWHIPEDQSLQCLSRQTPVVIAASRSRPFSKEPSSFDELLDRSALRPEQKAFWLEYAAAGGGCNS
jgi:hypothetical protein